MIRSNSDWKTRALVAALFAGGLTAAPASAAIVFDTFEGEGATVGDDAADPTDVPWTALGGSVTLSVVTDEVLGPAGNQAMQIVSTATAFRGASGALPSPVTLGADAGSQLILSMNFRIVGTPNADSSGLRIALAAPGETNDKGYNARMGTGGSSGLELGFDGGTSGRGFSGGDFTVLTDPGATLVDINDNLAHELVLTLTRRADSGIDLSFNIDGGTVEATATDPTASLDTFESILIGNGGSYSYDWAVDNVQLVVPEPASLALMGLGLFAMLRRKAHA